MLVTLMVKSFATFPGQKNGLSSFPIESESFRRVTRLPQEGYGLIRYYGHSPYHLDYVTSVAQWRVGDFEATLHHYPCPHSPTPRNCRLVSHSGLRGRVYAGDFGRNGNETNSSKSVRKKVPQFSSIYLTLIKEGEIVLEEYESETGYLGLQRVVAVYLCMGRRSTCDVCRL